MLPQFFFWGGGIITYWQLLLKFSFDFLNGRAALSETDLNEITDWEDAAVAQAGILDSGKIKSATGQQQHMRNGGGGGGGLQSTDYLGLM